MVKLGKEVGSDMGGMKRDCEHAHSHTGDVHHPEKEERCNWINDAIHSVYYTPYHKLNTAKKCKQENTHLV